MVGIGTLINMGTVLVGGSIGLALKGELPPNMEKIVTQGLGLITIVIGLQMAIETQNIFIPMASIVIGGILGELCGIKNGLDRFGDHLKQRLGSCFTTELGREFSQGFVTASLVFCVGPMTILGAIQDGLTGDYSLLAIKAGLDGFASIAFAASMGAGVLFSLITLLVYQGGLTLVAALFRGMLTGAEVSQSLAVTELSATGGILIIGIGLVLLEITDVKITNYLPAIILAPMIVGLMHWIGIGG